MLHLFQMNMKDVCGLQLMQVWPAIAYKEVTEAGTAH